MPYFSLWIAALSQLKHYRDKNCTLAFILIRKEELRYNGKWRTFESSSILLQVLPHFISFTTWSTCVLWVVGQINKLEFWGEPCFSDRSHSNLEHGLNYGWCVSLCFWEILSCGLTALFLIVVCSFLDKYISRQYFFCWVKKILCPC